MDNQNLSIPILAGQTRKPAGTIQARVGMRTSEGVIDRITPSGTAFIGKAQYRKPYKQLTVTVTEARKFGFVPAVQQQAANASA